MDSCKSAFGRRVLREWMLKPLLDIPALRLRQDIVQFLIEPSSKPVVEVMSRQLKRVKDLGTILRRVKRVQVRSGRAEAALLGSRVAGRAA